MNEIVQFQSTDFWVKVVEMLQQNWALIEPEGPQAVRVYFIHDLSGVFDEIRFDSAVGARIALTRNGFQRFADDPELRSFLRPPEAPFRRAKHPNGPIYSSGRFWDSDALQTILLRREETSVASAWAEFLCLQETASGRFKLSTCSRLWLGSIHELIPEEDRYDDAGELLVPDTWEGHNIVGLGDGEYLETDEMIVRTESPEFDRASMDVALEYCAENCWLSKEGFSEAWAEAELIVQAAPWLLGQGPN